MPLSELQKERLKEIYATTFTADIAIEFGVSIYQIRNAAFDLKLYKDKEWIKERSRINMLREDHPGRKFWIKKGSVPKNKGKKITEYMSPEAIEKNKKTRFKKGQKSHNERPIGFERITKDGYVEIKVKEPNKFKLKHRIVWEQHYGKIPEGFNIQFIDKNPLNITIENLYIISRSDQMRKENSMYAKYPKEIRLAITANATLKRKINKYLKEEQ